MTQRDTVDAGSFAIWLGDIGRALNEGATSDVPCGSCNQCCRASQFIHIEPDEAAALARIPAELLFAAPGLPTGHVLMGYGKDGACPMLRNNACTIYDDRPRTCRVYDCRIFAASEVLPDEPSKAGVSARVEQWEFTYDSDYAQLQQRAISSAARYLGAHALAIFGLATTDAMRDSLVALRIFDTFISDADVVEPDVDTVKAAVEQSRRRVN